MEDKNLEQNKSQEAAKNTAHTAGKAAATYFGGAAGNQIYNEASNTEVGQKIEQAIGNGIKQNPALNKVSETLNDSRALDVANNVMDLASGGAKTGASGSSNASSGNTSATSGIPKLGGGLDKLAGGENTESSSASSSSSSEGKLLLDVVPTSSKIKIIAAILASCSGIFMAYLVLYVTVIGPADRVVEFFKGIFGGIANAIVDFFTVDQQELEERYYNRLQDVHERMKNDYNICIDVNLINAALTVNRSFDEVLEDGNCNLNCDTNNDGTCDMNCDTNGDDICDQNCDYEGDLDDGTCDSHCDEDDTECFEQCDSEAEYDDDTPYSKMTKQIELLARMQMTTKYYSLDENHYKNTGSYCKETESIEPVTESNKSGFDYNLFDWLSSETPVDSSTPNKISQNDMGSFNAFFTKKAKEEINAAYYYYYPAFDENGECSKKYAKKSRPKNDYSISIGEYKNAEDYVFYWNLVNSFIPEYYADNLPDDATERQQKILEIADDIYSLYDSTGPSELCESSYGNLPANCSDLDVNNTSLTKEEFIAGINKYQSGNDLWYLIKDNADQIYDVSVYNGLNPEIVVTRAILEGFAPGNRCGFTNYNIWGWGATNGKECEKGKVWNTWDAALEGFITGFKKSFPTTETFLTKYAYLGDYWYNPGNAGLGGCYYAKYIYPNGLPVHVANACDVNKEGQCTKDNTSNCVKTTAEDRLNYGKYQARNTNNLRKNIWNITEGSCGSYGMQEGSCILFKQGDERWKSETLINGSTTLGKAGCAVTSVSIAMTCSGTLKNPNTFNPSVLNQELRPNQSKELYGAGIVWDNKAISNLTNGFHYTNSLYLNGTASEKANKLKELIKERRALIIHTTSRKISPNAGSHFVVLSSINGTNVRILDPATGQPGNWSTEDIGRVIIYEW